MGRIFVGNWITRDGSKATVAARREGSGYPWVGWVEEDKGLFSWSEIGRYHVADIKSVSDLIHPDVPLPEGYHWATEDEQKCLPVGLMLLDVVSMDFLSMIWSRPPSASQWCICPDAKPEPEPEPGYVTLNVLAKEHGEDKVRKWFRERDGVQIESGWAYFNTKGRCVICNPLSHYRVPISLANEFREAMKPKWEDVPLARNQLGVLGYEERGGYFYRQVFAAAEPGFMCFVYLRPDGTEYTHMAPVRRIGNGNLLFPIAWRRSLRGEEGEK